MNKITYICWIHKTHINDVINDVIVWNGTDNIPRTKPVPSIFTFDPGKQYFKLYWYVTK